MNMNEYQQKALTTVMSPEEHKVTYPVLGLLGEAGEIANKWKKHLRGDVKVASNEDLAKELGDVLWYVAVLADQLGMKLDDVAQKNVDKLSSRMQRGEIKGSGDNR